MARSRPSNRGEVLRNQIFALLNKKKVSADAALKALTQCQTHIRNRIVIEEIGKECGVTLSGFRAGEHLELCYDMKRGRHDVGCISKGWNEPGFRVGDIIEVPKWNNADMKEHLYVLLTYCATRGVAVTIEEAEHSIELQLDSVIYSEGLNKQVFEQVLQYLQECVEKAHELIA
jgi:hypothetical protein